MSETASPEHVAARLEAVRAERCVTPGVRARARAWRDEVLEILFPHFSDRTPCSARDLASHVRRAAGELGALSLVLGGPELDVWAWAETLPTLQRALVADAEAIVAGDPAATGVDEVILTYPGFFATAVHRIAHGVDALGVPLLPRLLAESAHRDTGIDIHPRARIGPSFFIDHGTGVVIGETAVIGRGVKLYQGVTLGALQVARELAGSKRHPTLEDHVVVYANATILGGETVIGHDSVIGGNAWITQSVPPFSALGRSPDPRPRQDRGPENLDFVI